MTMNFNNGPYFDDFSPSKNYHRILFKPGVAVQARELTQSQTILQDQITKFADNIFKQNSPVTGGQVTTNFNVFYVKLQDTYLNQTYDVTNFNGISVQNSDGTVTAKVVTTVSSTGPDGDPNTLILSYTSGTHFSDGDIIYDSNSNLAAQAIISNATGKSSVVSITDGVFYILGNFVQVNQTTTVLSKYDNTPSVRVGLNISENIYNFNDDSTLLDPALGSSNFQAPGADRYVISLSLETKPLEFGNDDNFVELMRVINGSIYKMVNGSVYNIIDDYFAKRDYETNGDYVVNDFQLTPKANSTVDSVYTMSIGKGLAYVHGYRIENPAPLELSSNRARTTQSKNQNPISINYGSYFFVNNLKGNTSFFDITTVQSVDFHCVPSINVSYTSASSYSASKVATGYIRNLEYSFNTGLDTDGTTYVFRAFVYDLVNNNLNGTVTVATSNTITFPSTFSSMTDAYVGVNITILSGTNAGDIKTIVSYDGTLKVAKLNSNWTVTPDTSSKYALIFDTKDIESIILANKTSYPATRISSCDINNASKFGGISTGDTILENSSTPEMIFKIGEPYVNSLSDSSYVTNQLFRNVSFSGSAGNISAQLNYDSSSFGVIRHLGTPSSTLSSDLVKNYYTIIVTDKGTNTLINNGDIVPWVNSNRSVSMDSDSSIATFTSTDLNPFTATIIAKAYVENANDGLIQKVKNLIKSNTQVVMISGTQVNTYTFVDDTSLTSSGQVYIQNAGLVVPGQKQSLYLSDVKAINKIIDTKDPTKTPTLSMINDPQYDVTNSYVFDNGQRDNYYNHATITLRTGAKQPIGNLWILLDYYQHSGGDGYFSIYSYTSGSTNKEDYRTLPIYKSSHNIQYNLRDCVDFRPTRKNATSSFLFDYSVHGTQYGIIQPLDQEIFTTDYSFYLGRKDKVVLTKDGVLNIIEGSPAINPIPPTEPDGSLVLANLTHTPYTGFLPTETPPFNLPDLSIERVKHKRYTMKDISNLDDRINNIEYYTSLNLLEKDTQSLQISDSFGLNRFKNGILVDGFADFSVADTFNNDYSANINGRKKQLSPAYTMLNFNLKDINLSNSINNLSATSLQSLNYVIGKDGLVNYFMLPYTTTLLTSQKLASKSENLNPFAFVTGEGTVRISPNVDNWIDNKALPSLLITDPNLKVFRQGNNQNILEYGDALSYSSTVGTSLNFSYNQYEQPGSFIPGEWGIVSYDSNGNPVYGHTKVGSQSLITDVTRTETFDTTTVTNQNKIVGNYDNIGNTYSLNNNYITNISVLPWIRSQSLYILAFDLLHSTPIHAYFDKELVDNFIRKSNIIEFNNMNGVFGEGDIIGYLSSGIFHPTGLIVGGALYEGTLNGRLYVVSDDSSPFYSNGNTIYSAKYDPNGIYINSPASATIVSTNHFAGKVNGSVTSNKTVTLNYLASSIDNYYTGNTIYFSTGTGIGQSAQITSYVGSTKIATLDKQVIVSIGDVYSIGDLKSNEFGSFYGIFNIPSSTFHTGERIFRLDNATLGNSQTATSYCEGSFYSQGLSTTSQQLDFGASAAGAKNTFSSTETTITKSTSVQVNTLETKQTIPCDPLAQTFMIDGNNYPSGAFIKNIKLFFRTKPVSDNIPVTLYVHGTLNGYPNGDTLPHGIVTLTRDKVNISENPQYLDSTTYTQFDFDVPIYIQPDVLYSFILRSKSSEYNIWTALGGDTALASSTKNLPTDATPTTITKIGAAPYVGGLFKSQNSITWTVDQNQSLMFTMDRCVFSKNQTSTINFTIPKNLPERTIINESIDVFINPNNISNTDISYHTSDVLVDAFNMTTTDFVPTSTGITYNYYSTLLNGSRTPQKTVTPGKYASTMYDNVLLNDGSGERVLKAKDPSSFSLVANLITTNDAVSPMVADSGLTLFAIQNSINNCELSNSLITMANTGDSYSLETTTVTISAPTGKYGSQALATANVVGGIVDKINIIYSGSGYIETPSITITSPTGHNAVAYFAGETSPYGGPALSKYITKKVALDSGFDSGDLNVYLTAYRPTNTDILVYYKILSRSDTQKFDDGNWQLMTKIKNSDTLYSSNLTDYHEYIFAPGTGGNAQGYVTYTGLNGQIYSSFSQFSVKIVMLTTDKTNVPIIKDMRTIALPSDTNTTF